jgi:hypothetical protein
MLDVSDFPKTKILNEDPKIEFLGMEAPKGETLKAEVPKTQIQTTKLLKNPWRYLPFSSLPCPVCILALFNPPSLFAKISSYGSKHSPKQFLHFPPSPCLTNLKACRLIFGAPLSWAGLGLLSHAREVL